MNRPIDPFPIAAGARSPEELLDLQAEGENLDAFADAVEASRAQRVLDVGCGSGALSRLLASRLPAGGDLIGIDRSESRVRHCRSRARTAGLTNVHFVHSDIADFAEAHGGMFDLVLCKYVLMCALPDARAVNVLRAMAACVAPGGRLCVLEPDIRFIADGIPEPSRHLRSVLEDIDRYFRVNALIEWRRGITLSRLFAAAGLGGATVRLVEGRIVSGGRPAALVEHDSCHLEELMEPVLRQRGDLASLAPLAAEWRAVLSDRSGFHYTPIFLATWRQSGSLGA